jgi:hypothetical protein
MGPASALLALSRRSSPGSGSAPPGTAGRQRSDSAIAIDGVGSAPSPCLAGQPLIASASAGVLLDSCQAMGPA